MILNILIIILFGIGYHLGSKNGFIKEIGALVGLIVIYGIAFLGKGSLGFLFCKIFPFFTFSGRIKGITSLNVLFYHILAFFLILSILYIGYSIWMKFSSFIQKLVNYTIIGILPSKILGGLCASIITYVWIFITLLILYIPLHSYANIENSFLARKILYDSPLSYTINDITKTIEEMKPLVIDIKEQKISPKESNQKLIKIMIKYKLVNKDTIEELQRLGKLKIE